MEPSSVDNRDVFHNMPPQMTYVQFVPGCVDSIKENGVIEAHPHVGEAASRPYIPLLRGINETPGPGDPVLLCTFGHVDYYIGPINPDNNPNYNRDKFYESPVDATTTHEQLGLDNDFPLNTGLARMGKRLNVKLDGESKPTHGDVLFEGRHANSIRIGSRSGSPHIIFSNQRGLSNKSESVLDGGLVALLNKGSIEDHFGAYYGEDPENRIFGYRLGSDDREEPNRTMSQLIATSLGDENITETIYGYSRDQLFQSSDRLVFNAKKEHMFLSANRNVNIGAGEHLTLSSNNKILFGASNIYLGKEESSQGLVLGENLRTVVEEMLDILISTVGNLNGAPVPLLENPVMGAASPIGIKLNELKGKLKKDAPLDFVSTKHFLEHNTE
jgi:hypothetical protein|tara:strand:- start:4904 stop:6061 length:1158 start_codon:yes stop_codon:yes gene_type:complete